MLHDLQDLFAKAVAAGHEALELTAEDGDNTGHDKAEAARLEVESDKVAYAFKGASNYGVDTFLTLQTAQPDGHVLILLQSKQSSSTSTHTLEHALQQMDQDLMRSGISVQGRQHVEGKLYSIRCSRPRLLDVLHHWQVCLAVRTHARSWTNACVCGCSHAHMAAVLRATV